MDFFFVRKVGAEHEFWRLTSCLSDHGKTTYSQVLLRKWTVYGPQSNSEG